MNLNSFTDITHLALIKDVLEDAHFMESQWFDLGFKLNLPINKLKNIESNHSYDMSRRLIECLNLWLQSGKARPQLLARVLSGMGYNSDDVRKICMYI